ncbi:MAG: glycosyltransferase family 39 protein [Dehalococcoidia bacterium]
MTSGVRATATPGTLVDRVREFVDQHWWALDAVLIAVLLIIAGVLRLVLLGDIPYGVHPDEAQVGTDAHRIVDGDLWAVYTTAALGQPTGHAYFSTPSIWLLGDTAFALRLPLALVGLAAIPLLYAFVRTSFGRTEAFFAGAMLALSYWHLLYSRVAHWSISYGTVILAVLLCTMLGRNTKQRWWFVAGGVLLGLGIYTYNIYPIAVVAVLVFIGIMWLIDWRNRDDRRWWLGSTLAFGAAAFVVALPMFIYLSNPDAYYWKHIDNYQEVGVARSAEWDDASFAGKIRLTGEQAWTFFRTYTHDADWDIVDANGIRPVFDPLTLILIVAGLLFAWRHRRDPVVIAALCCALIIPLPAVTQNGSIMRQPVAAAPFVMLIAALPLAAVWRAGLDDRRRRTIAFGSVAVVLAVLTATTVRDYFWTWREHPFVREIYFSEFTTVSTFMDGFGDDAYFYLYSDRAPLSQETRQYLAPDAEGEDRSFEFSNAEASIEDIDRGREAVFVLLEPYFDLLPQIEARYPGGRAVEATRDGKIEFYAYVLPAVEDGRSVGPP